MTLQEIAERFPGGRWHGDTYETHCPCAGHEHGDRKPSLGFSPGDNGGIVAYCQKGHAVAEILAAVGLTTRDLAPNGNAPNGARAAPEAVYRYDDEQGQPLYEKVRLPPGAAQRFWLRLPGAKAGGIGETRRALYHLPALLATPPGSLVGVCEGEKDAENLIRHGLPATTNPEGAALPGQRPKWKPEYTAWLKEHLADRRFAVFADQDEAGLAHAEAVYESLKAAGLNVFAVEMPGLKAKEDVSDWLGRHTDEEFQALLKPKPPRLFARFLTFEQLLEQPEPEWRVEGFCFAETLFELFGPPNQGKTFVMTDFCLAVRQGGYWCGRKIHTPGPVVYVNADGGKGFAKRARAWVEINGEVEAAHEFWTYPSSINLYREQDMIEFRAALAYMDEPPAVVVFDTYSRCIPGVNENQQEEASLVVEHLDQMKLQFGCTVSLLHHTGKDGVTDRGSSVILGAMDTAARVDQKDDVVMVTCEKQRDAAFFEAFYFDLGRVPGTNAVWITSRDQPPPQTPTDRKEEEMRLLVELVRTEPGITRERAALLLDIHERTCERYAKTLVMRGELVEAPLPRKPGQEGRVSHGLFLRAVVS